MYKSKTAILSLAVLVGLGTFAPAVGATSNSIEQAEQQIKISSIETSSVDKNELIKKLHELFPDKYDFLDARDFYVDQFYYPGDQDVERVSLSFHKNISNNKYVYGNLEFIGEEHKLQSFYAEPVDLEGAMYPAKVSQEDAKEIASTFVDRVVDSSDYVLKEGRGSRYHWRNRTLTEPIEYEFYYQKVKDGIPVSGQGVTVVVLGNGEIINFYAGGYVKEAPTYEKNENVLPEDQVLETVQNTLDVELRYMVEQLTPFGEAKAKLVYVPRPYLEGIHASDGKWLIDQNFVEELPKQKEIKMLESEDTSEPKAVTKEEVRELAESMLAEESEHGTLFIEGVYEEKMGNVDSYSVSYQYRDNRGGVGTSFSVNKENGEIIHFNDISKDYYYNSKPTINLSYEEGLKAAMEAVQTYAPYTMSQHAEPLDVHYQSADQGMYFYQFPRIQNGLVVEGAALRVSISAEDGSLISFDNHPVNVNEWAETELAVSKEEALKAFKEKTKVELTYQNLYRSENPGHYYLVYTPEFQEPSSYFDATKGDWSKIIDDQAGPILPSLEGHWAEDEISYLIESGILTIADVDAFHPNRQVTKGTALEVLVKSIFYVDDYRYEQNPKQSFENIDKDHPLFSVVEVAVEKNILNAKDQTLDLDAPISREELAFWFIRSLGYENVAKYKNIYQVPFVDQQKINNDYLGHVALAYAFGIFQGDAKNQFRPQDEVTFAHLSVANFRFAKKAVELNIERW